MRHLVIALVLTAALVLSGCGVGVVYTHTWQPYTIDMHRTPVSATGGEGDIKHIALPGTAIGVAWDDAAIGDIARKNGLQELYFADLETLRILYVWNRYTLHLYGK